MKAIPVFATMLAIIVSAGPAECQWTSIYPSTPGYHLNDVIFFDANTAVAFGEDGIVIRSTDAGETWSVACEPNPSSETLTAGQHVSAGFGLVGGNDGVVLDTNDSGETWSLRSYSPFGDIDDLSFGTISTGMAVSDQQIIKTENGGVTWDLVELPLSEYDTEYAINAVFMTDELHATAVGDVYSGLIYTILTTDDGGVTWTLRNPPTTLNCFHQEYTTVYYADADHGVIAGDCIVLETSDGGETWTLAAELYVHHSSVDQYDIVFVPGGRTISVGMSVTCPPSPPVCSLPSGIRFETEDGNAWTETYPLNQALNGVAFDNGTAIAVGQMGEIQRDTGSGWSFVNERRFEQQTPGGCTFVENNGLVFSAGANEGGPYGGFMNVLRTTDGGMSWTYHPVYAVKRGTAALADATTAYAAGTNYYNDEIVVAKSVDAGETWSVLWSTTDPVPAPGPGPIMLGIDFATPSHGIAVGWKGNIVAIENDVCTPINVGTGVNLYGVSFPSPTRAIAVGTGGSIFRSEDGGYNWDIVDSGTTQHLRAVHFFNDLAGTAVGVPGTVLRTDDGGATWTPQASSTSAELLGVHMSSATVATAVGDGGVIIHTDNGGADWATEPSGTFWRMGGVCPNGDGDWIAVGARQTILRRPENPIPVLITSFDARVVNHTVRLVWSMIGDNDVHDLSIYRSVEGQEAVEISGTLAPTAREYHDVTTRPGVSYTYTLIVTDGRGVQTQSVPVTVELPAVPFGVVQNHPNPFNPNTTIRFTLAETGPVEIAIYDASGRLVRTLFAGELPAGPHARSWDGLDHRGTASPSGLYFCRLKTRTGTSSIKMTLVK